MVRIEYIDWDCLLSEGRLTRVFVLEIKFHVCLFPFEGDCSGSDLKGQIQEPQCWRSMITLSAVYLWHTQGS